MENKKSFCASAILLCITFPAVSQLRDTGVGTVIDTASGLMWLKDAGCFSLSTWYDAKANVSALNTHGAGQGCYEYTGAYRDWRLPTREEFDSLTDPTQSKPALPAGHPFRNVDASSNWGWYWTSSAYGSDPEKAWMIGMAYGQWMPGFKQNYGNTLPVRTHVEAPTGPSFSFSSGSLVFEDTQVNSRSASRTIAVTNTGAATKILSVYASEDFPLSGTCVGSMATGTSCTISVAFQPTRAGHFSAPMTISTTDGQLDGPMLSGNAFAATEGGTEFKTPVQITMKTTHACGVDGNGVLCWGSNDSGQLQTPSGLVRPSQVAAG